MLKSFGKVFGASVLALGLVLGGATIVKNNIPVNNGSTEIVAATTRTVKVVTEPTVGITVTNTTKEDTITLLKPGNEEQLILFNTPVMYETVEAAISRLETLKAKGYKEAYLILNSPGGSVFDGARLVAWIKHSPMKVNTICDGLCASMAAHLFEVGKTRYMTDKSTLMFHPASGGVQGTLQQMESRLSYVSNYVNGLDIDIAARAGIDYKTFRERMLVEYWVETKDAVANGLADNLVFLSYNRASGSALDMEEHMRKLGKIIPNDLRKIGILRLDTIRLQDTK